MKDKGNRDFGIVYHINKHYKDIKDGLVEADSLDVFINNQIIRKVLLFDLLQIGELLNHLSKQFVKDFGEEEIYSIINVRHRIVHGYGEVNDQLIYTSLKTELPRFIDRLNAFSLDRYLAELNKFINKNITIFENSGQFYVDELTSLDGFFQKVKPASNKIVLIDKKIYKVTNISKIDNVYYLEVE